MISHTQDLVDEVLAHFDAVKINSKLAEKIAMAAELAFSDRLLFEKFELWNEERDDEVFIFHVSRFLEKKDQRPLAETKRDRSSERKKVENDIKTRTRERQKRIFSERLMTLAAEHDLLTNEQLGKFLGVSAEQARKYKSGEYKPRLTTLHEISKRFNVSAGFLIGLNFERKSHSPPSRFSLE